MTDRKLTAADHRRLFKLAENEGFSAADGTADGKFLDKLEKDEIVACYDAMFGRCYYNLTKHGEKEMFGG